MKGTQILFDSETTENIEYVGVSASGTAKDLEQWQIKAIEKDSSGTLVSIKFANGEADYNKAWDNRATYEYL